MQKDDYVEFKSNSKQSKYHRDCLYRVEVVTLDNRVKLESSPELVDPKLLQVVPVKP